MKKILAFVAPVVIAFAITGCTGSDDLATVAATSPVSTTPVSTTAAPSESPTADAAAAAAATEARRARAKAKAKAKARAKAKAKARAAKRAKARAAAEAAEREATQEPAPPADVYYANCDAVRAAGAAPIRVGDPGYSRQLDRDGDGVACET